MRRRERANFPWGFVAISENEAAKRIEQGLAVMPEEWDEYLAAWGLARGKHLASRPKSGIKTQIERVPHMTST